MAMEYNPLDTMISSLEKHSSAKVELKQRLPDGTYMPAPNGTLEAIGSQAKIAATAGVIQNMTSQEKTDWAISKKDEGNVLYSQHQYNEAIQVYMEVKIWNLCPPLSSDPYSVYHSNRIW
jgi:hypothetical protein